MKNEELCIVRKQSRGGQENFITRLSSNMHEQSFLTDNYIQCYDNFILMHKFVK